LWLAIWRVLSWVVAQAAAVVVVTALRVAVADQAAALS
jgi:hypothetical protein